MKKLVALVIAFFAGTWFGGWVIYRVFAQIIYVIATYEEEGLVPPPTTGAERLEFTMRKLNERLINK